MTWQRAGQHALRRGPWAIGRAMVPGAGGQLQARYVLTHDARLRTSGGVQVHAARYFDSAAAAKAAAEKDEAGGNGLD